MITLLMGTFGMSISQSAMSTAYPTLMRTFQVGADTVQWLTTGFMLVMSILIPVSPWLLNNLRFKTLFRGVLLVFSLGTLLCISAPSFWVLLAGRLLEAVAVGIIFPSYQTVLLTITPEANRGFTMGIAGLVMGSALAVGPIISGIILQYISWQAIFGLFLVLMLVAFIASYAFIKNVMPRHRQPIDLFSVVYALGFPGVMWALNELTHGLQFGWLILLVASIVAIWAFIRRQNRQKVPFLQLRVFRAKAFRYGVYLTGISYIALIVTTIIMPLYFQQVLHISPLASGLSLVPAAVVLSLLNPIAGKLFDHWSGTKVIALGMSLIVVGMGLMTLFASRRQLWIAIIMAIITESGNAFVMMPAVTMGSNALPEDLLAHGTAVITTARQILGSLGVMVATQVLTLVTQHSQYLGQLPAQIRGFQMTFGLFTVIGILGLILTFQIQRQALAVRHERATKGVQ
ncbi:MFS transporter [Agrilactobacillus fermenti]|uniref:MFS transporter n=1 Tax=Agrilactobacillus fermenti TaxID=2586909 RepID=UPI001E49E11F|nr:MFS transporter [Agrilactobacillus fermenti]MCD2255540.1 MFS transporter [Agrilactobacillus fermenti]